MKRNLKELILVHELPTYTPTKAYIAGQLLQAQEFNGELRALESYTDDVKAYFDSNVTTHLYELIAGDGINIDFDDSEAVTKATISIKDLFNSRESSVTGQTGTLPVGSVITTPFPYNPGLDNLVMYVNNEKWVKGLQYFEIGGTGTEADAITLATDLNNGDSIEFVLYKVANTTEITNKLVELNDKVEDISGSTPVDATNIGVVGLPATQTDGSVSVEYKTQDGASLKILNEGANDSEFVVDTATSTFKGQVVADTKLKANTIFEGDRYSKDLSAMGSDFIIITIDDDFKNGRTVVQRGTHDYYVWDANELVQGDRNMFTNKIGSVIFEFLTSGDRVLVTFNDKVANYDTRTDNGSYVGLVKLKTNSTINNSVWLEEPSTDTSGLKAYTLNERQDNTYVEYRVVDGAITWTWGVVKQITNLSTIDLDVSTLGNPAIPTWIGLPINDINQDTDDVNYRILHESTSVTNGLVLDISKDYFADISFKGIATKDAEFSNGGDVRVILEYSTVPEAQITDTTWEVISGIEWNTDFSGGVNFWTKTEVNNDLKISPNHVFRIRGIDIATNTMVNALSLQVKIKETGGII